MALQVTSVISADKSLNNCVHTCPLQSVRRHVFFRTSKAADRFWQGIKDHDSCMHKGKKYLQFEEINSKLGLEPVS